MWFIATKFDPKQIEQKWKRKWLNERIFEANPDDREKCMVTFPFPYVNGPLHLGHTFTLTRLDVYARFKRMQGFNTLFPFAFHATGEPIVGVAERLAKGDEVQKRVLLDEGIDEKDLTKFKDPKYIARYWEKRIEEDVKALGVSIDWRRSFMTIDPIFNRFISWQYRLLKKRGYLYQGTHPVVWCPHCESPTGDHDRLKGEGEGPIEFTLLKFKFGDTFIVAATLRPETVFGQTNMWVNPDVEYVKARVDDKETWIMSRECAEKLKEQLHRVKIKGTIKGKELIGKYCTAPMIEKEMLILPAKFCDPKIGSGLVTSVPSHAPYDWQGLVDLKNNPKELKKYGIDQKIVDKIEPISIIKVEGFGEHPAKEICEKLEIESQEDSEKLDEALKIIYKKEHHTGVMKDNCGNYKGMSVEQAKNMIKEELIRMNQADVIYEPTDEVVCRCGTTCYIKILENQWFLRFSDERWKEKVRICLRKMGIYPEEARRNFESVVEWLQDKACARKSGLGTKLPWDKEWIVETLSDSVIYMAFYTIRNHLEGIEPHQLTDDVFDYIFLGKGNLKKVSKESGISEKTLKEMKKEFEYWYGFDMRGSAKELVPNHLTYSIFHHVAIWDDPKKWPKGFMINGMQQMYGQKMSKSKGNFITLKDAIEKYTADAIRITVMDAGEGLEDPDWTEQQTIAWKKKLNSFYNMVKEYYGKGTDKRKYTDVWIESRFQDYIKKITQHLERTENRSALTYFHLMFNDLQWYLKRAEPNKNTVNYVLETMTKILAPYSPFISEEIWSSMKRKEFISVAEWPKSNENLIEEEVMRTEESFKNTCEDIKQIVKLSGKNENLYIYVVNEKELNYYSDAEKFLKKEFGFEKIDVFLVNDPKRYDPENRAKRAKFGKPGIFVE